MYYFYGELPQITYLECNAICLMYSFYEDKEDD